MCAGTCYHAAMRWLAITALVALAACEAPAPARPLTPEEAGYQQIQSDCQSVAQLAGQQAEQNEDLSPSRAHQSSLTSSLSIEENLIDLRDKANKARLVQLAANVAYRECMWRYYPPNSPSSSG